MLQSSDKEEDRDTERDPEPPPKTEPKPFTDRQSGPKNPAVQKAIQEAAKLANTKPPEPKKTWNESPGSVTLIQKSAIKKIADELGIDLIIDLDPRNLDLLSEKSATEYWQNLNKRRKELKESRK